MLLSADENGTVRLWLMQQHLGNVWECAHAMSAGSGEAIVTIEWISGENEVSKFKRPSPKFGGGVVASHLPRVEGERYLTGLSLIPPEAIGSVNLGWLVVTRYVSALVAPLHIKL